MFYKITVNDQDEIHELPENVDLPEGAVEVPPRPLAEDGDPAPGYVLVKGEWVLDGEQEQRDVACPKDILESHLIKRMEATLITSGVSLTTGLLFEEAAATGVTVEDLAEAVVSASSESREKEVRRRVAIVEARTSKSTNDS